MNQEEVELRLCPSPQMVLRFNCYLELRFYETTNEIQKKKLGFELFDRLLDITENYIILNLLIEARQHSKVFVLVGTGQMMIYHLDHM